MSEETKSNFIRNIIDHDLETGKNGDRVATRFPPEPNGYIHIGHAKSICLNFGIARDYKGTCNLRFDDTNPTKEDVEYVDSIMEDIHWLGFDWEDRLYFASDYFDALYEYAVQLIKDGKAFVDELTPDQIRELRGTLTEPGKESPFRNRPIEESLALFQEMKDGKHEEGTLTLRAKIDMASPNLNMRDPVVYRIRKAHHHRTGDKWCIYPMYDYTHCMSDALEKITHSLCTLEFEDHRPLYDWFLDQLPVPSHPQQIEFARLNINYTIMSKRKLLALVTEKIVNGWDDPRMPTIAGLRRRGFTSESIREFSDRIGMAKSNSTADISLLFFCLREDLNKRAARVMAVIDPVKVIVTNYPEDQEEWFDAENNPEDENAGTRKIPFSRELYIEREDFMIDPPKKFFRLSPGAEIRLKHAYYVTCTGYETDEDGNITEIHCTYDPNSRGGWTEDGRKVKGTSHWVSAKHAEDIEVRLYDHLFTVENPAEYSDFHEILNPESLVTITAKGEPSLKEAKPGTHFQFLRQGYFYVDPDTTDEHVVINRTVPLRDSFAKIMKSTK